MGKYYALKGIQDGKGPNGEVPVRMEIDDWWASRELVHVRQKSLLILAMRYIQASQPEPKTPDPKDPDEGKLSWYQIAGIHGKPWTTWDEDPLPNGNFKDYCQHQSVLFATWHRPYALLLEQRLYEVMRDIIIPEEYAEKDQTDMQAAAKVWRWPYWDWSLKKRDADGVEDYNVPRVVRLTEVEVSTKEGVKTVRNPFYAYRFPGSQRFDSFGKFAVDDADFRSTTSTSRHVALFQVFNYPQNRGKLWDAKNKPGDVPLVGNVTATKWVKGSQNNDNIMYEIQDTKYPGGGNLTEDWQDRVIRILKTEKFEEFATTARPPNDISGALSVEGIHNSVHNICGGTQLFSGHMASTAVAAFDPIFWLHHCNVDRIVAFWQAMHPTNKWFSSEEAQKPLKPFHKDTEGNLHTSSSIRSVEKLGYTYPGLESWISEHQTNGEFDPEKLKRDIKRRLNQKYASTRRAEQKAVMSVTADQPKGPSINELLHITEMQPPDIWAEIKNETIATPEAMKLIKSGVEVPEVVEADDYMAAVTYKPFGLQGYPYTIHLFIGDVPERPYTFAEQNSQVGQVYNFVSPLPTDNEPGCENCKRHANDGIECADGIVLTNALLTRQKQRILHSKDPNDYLPSMEPADVSKFLQKHLHWRITTQRGDEISKELNPDGTYQDPRLAAIGVKVAVAVGKAKHYRDDSKLSEYSDYKIMYEVTQDAASGTGARPADELFPQNPALTTTSS